VSSPRHNSENQIRMSQPRGRRPAGSVRRTLATVLLIGTGLGALALLALGVPAVVAAPAGAPASLDAPLDLIVTEVPASTAEPTPCGEGSRVVRWGGGGERQVLSGAMTACDPVLDAAAGRLVFRGRSGQEGAWRIWQLTLPPEGNAHGASVPVISDATPVPITSGEQSCGSPFFFPDGGVGFLCDGDLYRTPAGAEPGAGAEPVRLTSSGGAFEAASLLPDGRLLLASRNGAGVPLLVTAQPDGTWATRWRDAPFPGLQAARPVAPAGLLLAVGEGSAGAADAGLFRASLVDPFAPLQPLARMAAGAELRDPVGLPGGGALVSYRAAPGERFRVGRVAPEGSGAVEEVAADVGGVEAHALQPLALAPRTPDTPLPGIVKPELNTGYLVLFDAARSDLPELEGIGRADVTAVRIFPWGDGPRGATAVDLEPAADGSVFLEVPSDRPYGMALVGADGALIGPVGGPFWVRPNERRACMGCHVSTRYAPPNVRPLAMTAAPRWIGWGAERHGPRSELVEGSH